MTEDAPVRTLFVDDDRGFLDLASRLLETESNRIDVVTESSPRAALSSIADVDCVVSDYRMAELDGLAFLREVRERDPDLPFILFTAKGSEQIADEAIAAGVTDYVVNTGTPEQYVVLAHRVENAVRQRRAEVAVERWRRIDAGFRRVTRGLLDRTSRETLEAAVCERLAAIESYDFVLIGEPERAGAGLSPRAWAGREEPYAEALAGIERDRSGAAACPEAEVLETTAPFVVSDTGAVETDEPWFAGTGPGSMVTVPVSYRDRSYGVLTVRSTEVDLFDDVEVAALEDLGRLIGFAIGAVEKRRGLFSETDVEIELAIADPTFPLVELATEAETALVLEGAVPRSDGTVVSFLTIGPTDLDPEALVRPVRTIMDAAAVYHLPTDDPTSRWAVVSADCPAAVFADHGIRVREVTVEDGRGRLVLTAPSDTDVGSVVEIAESHFSDVELLARRSRTAHSRDEASVRRDFVRDLTARQYEVLETAYRSGFFEWPREMGTVEVAELLGITQPALSRHLRTAERKLFGRVFEDG